MKKTWENWNDLEENDKDYGDNDLPNGAYVCKITKVEEVTTGWGGKSIPAQLVLTYDIAEGAYKDKYANAPDSIDFMHQFSVGHEKNPGYFKHLISTLSKSNKGFDWGEEETNEQKLVGLNIGLIVSKFLYVYENEKRDKYICQEFMTCEEARAYNKPVEDRKSKTYDEDIKNIDKSDFDNTSADFDDSTGGDVPF